LSICFLEMFSRRPNLNRGSGSTRYNVRIYESRETPGATSPGTLVGPVDLTFTLYADSGAEAEKLLEKDVVNNKRQRGRVYQICPAIGNAELIRSIAFCADGTFQRVFLSPTDDLYSEVRRIRPFEPPPSHRESQPQSVSTS